MTQSTWKDITHTPRGRIKLWNVRNGTCAVAFILNGHSLGFQPQSQSKSHLVQHNKQLNRKELLSGFHLNGHFRISSADSNHPAQHSKQHYRTALLSTSLLNDHSLGFHPHTQDRITRYRTIEGKGAKKWTMLSFNSPPIRKNSLSFNKEHWQNIQLLGFLLYFWD